MSAATDHAPTKRRNIIRWMRNRLRRLDCISPAITTSVQEDRARDLRRQLVEHDEQFVAHFRRRRQTTAR